MLFLFPFLFSLFFFFFFFFSHLSSHSPFFFPIGFNKFHFDSQWLFVIIWGKGRRGSLLFGTWQQKVKAAHNNKRTGGSVVEFSPATREARVRFPAGAMSLSLILCLHNGRSDRPYFFPFFFCSEFYPLEE